MNLYDLPSRRKNGNFIFSGHYVIKTLLDLNTNE
jgi:hypothetical protein